MLKECNIRAIGRLLMSQMSTPCSQRTVSVSVLTALRTYYISPAINSHWESSLWRADLDLGAHISVYKMYPNGRE